MPFPSRGCHTCKKRRCDKIKPSCNRCSRAKISCQGYSGIEKYEFLNENEAASGKIKRPQDPNLRRSIQLHSSFQSPAPEEQKRHVNRTIDGANLIKLSSILHVTVLFSSPRPPPTTTLQDQVVAYYTRQFVEAPEKMFDNHNSRINRCVDSFEHSSIFSLASSTIRRHPSWPITSPERESHTRSTRSTLQLAILAIAHTTFGRSTKNAAALTIGSKIYSQALAATNLALRSSERVVMDEIILTVLLLSHFENSMTQKAQFVTEDIKIIAAKAFNHHDGAIAILNLRLQRQQEQYRPLCSILQTHTSNSSTSHENAGSELDKITRRHLVRSLLLRSMPIPSWLKNGSIFGEIGSSLVLDQCLVEVADLRYCVNHISIGLDDIPASASGQIATKVRGVLVLAQELEMKLVKWAKEIPMVDYWSSFRVRDDDDDKPGANDIFDQTVHLYPSISHAAMWAQYRAIRLHVNGIILKVFHREIESSNPDTKFYKDIVRLNMKKLALDFCASLPFVLGWVELGEIGMKMIRKGRRNAVRASTASLFCWPLTISTMTFEIPEQHRTYLKSRLRDISELVDDGVLETIAHL
ncbi:hypothetical protein BOTNAR_0777g00030 [Botryotinia narcissicola]|uniref:Zn(2)-C6 fungal-type domain-containing protein n=1 Tax=Botryotinia narcissicola TaxID=278944 RepID=A0A4Z1H8W9_9HELO|nr:hypothetical protein BOTNAR_0777g00030 [Botryotinia narcissicola]